MPRRAAPSSQAFVWELTPRDMPRSVMVVSLVVMLAQEIAAKIVG
jgi:hypothetical protein